MWLLGVWCLLGQPNKEGKILKYESPLVEIFLFVAREPLAGENDNKPAWVNDSLSLGDTPGFNEGVEEW